MELDGLIKVRWDTPLSESEIVERIPSIRMTRGTKE
jgi:hypothetical protein